MILEKIILPDFIIIGANKAGTTSIAKYLSQHPEIDMSSVKEPMFFSSNPFNHGADKKSATLGNPSFVHTISEYSNLFNSQKATTNCFGEASTSYLANARTSSTLIYKLIPNVKIVVILRNPVSRAISAYRMCVASGIESRTFYEIVSSVGEQDLILHEQGVREYIRNGLYSQLLQPYTKLFGSSNILYLTYDELCLDANKLLNKIVTFIPKKPFKFSTSIKYNALSKKDKSKMSINDESVNLLKNFYKSDILKTSALTNLDLSDWI